jgi:hypothetical protein
MGWLDPHHQRKVKRKYHIVAIYVCDTCNKPIQLGESPFINPASGFFPWPKTLPKDCRPLTSREPKETHHYSCWEKIHRKKSRFERCVDAVYALVKIKKRRGYWTKEKVVEKCKFKKKLVLNAIQYLREEKQIIKKHSAYRVR